MKTKENSGDEGSEAGSDVSGFAGELAQTIEEALAALPAKSRAVILLREVEGLSNPQAAKVLDLSESTIDRRIRAAQGKVEPWLAEFLRTYPLPRKPTGGRPRKEESGLSLEEVPSGDMAEFPAEPSSNLSASDLGHNPSKTVLRSELAEVIQAALDDLPEDYRAVILLREVQGLDYDQMSAVLRLPKGTIMSRLHHARNSMKTSLFEYLAEEPRIED